MPGWSLTSPAIDDLADLRQLLADCALPFSDIVGKHLPGFLICRDAGRLIAAAGLESCGEAVLLRSLAVAASHRQLGLASQLVEALERRARAGRRREIFLLTSTAAEFFARRGFRLLARDSAPQELAETREFRSLCPASAICMQKTLAAARSA